MVRTFSGFQSDWTASDLGSDSDLWAFKNYLEWFRHNSTISIGLKCVSWVFSLFQVGKMCFYNSESEKYNSLSWVSCVFLPFKIGICTSPNQVNQVLSLFRVGNLGKPNWLRFGILHVKTLFWPYYTIYGHNKYVDTQYNR